MQPKFLVDKNLDFRIITELRNKGIEIRSVLEDFQGINDQTVIKEAFRNNEILITEDKDFGEWVF